MNITSKSTPILSGLTTLELAGITLIRGYIQFLFDGPIFNVYVLPQIKIGDRIQAAADLGYYDALHRLIENIVSTAYEDEIEEKIVVRFESDMEFFVSLKPKDRESVEAAMLQLEPGVLEVW